MLVVAVGHGQVVLNQAMVSATPSANWIDGDQPRSLVARLMSGLRRVGSSDGSGRCSRTDAASV